MRKTIYAALSLFLLCTVVLAGCTSEQDVQVSSNAFQQQPGTAMQEMPKFSGPWAAEFTQYYQETESELARQILSKGVILESDLAEVQQVDKVCLESQGFTAVKLTSGGGMEITPPDGMSAETVQNVVKQCDDDSGLTPVEVLYNSMMVNPNNEDMDELVIQCLKDNGIVEQSFTVEDLVGWGESEDPRLVGDGSAVACSRDPLGLLSK